MSFGSSMRTSAKCSRTDLKLPSCVLHCVMSSSRFPNVYPLIKHHDYTNYCNNTQ